VFRFRGGRVSIRGKDRMDERETTDFDRRNMKDMMGNG
jgi:hypothetical protein